MFLIKSVYITVPHESHNTILCVLACMVHVALRRITAQYQIQISDENTCIYISILTELQILQLNKMIYSAHYISQNSKITKYIFHKNVL